MRRQLTLNRLESLEFTKKTLLRQHREYNDERRARESSIADIRTRNREDGILDDDDQALAELVKILGRVEDEIERVAKEWDRVEVRVEEACAEIAVGAWD